MYEEYIGENIKVHMKNGMSFKGKMIEENNAAMIVRKVDNYQYVNKADIDFIEISFKY